MCCISNSKHGKINPALNRRKHKSLAECASKQAEQFYWSAHQCVFTSEYSKVPLIEELTRHFQNIITS